MSADYFLLLLNHSPVLTVLIVLAVSVQICPLTAVRLYYIPASCLAT